MCMYSRPKLHSSGSGERREVPGKEVEQVEGILGNAFALEVYNFWRRRDRFD